jgi:hypothetical protein
MLNSPLSPENPGPSRWVALKKWQGWGPLVFSLVILLVGVLVIRFAQDDPAKVDPSLTQTHRLLLPPPELLHKISVEVPDSDPIRNGLVTIRTPQGDELLVEVITGRLVAVRNGKSLEATDPFTGKILPHLKGRPVTMGPMDTKDS